MRYWMAFGESALKKVILISFPVNGANQGGKMIDPGVLQSRKFGVTGLCRTISSGSSGVAIALGN